MKTILFAVPAILFGMQITAMAEVQRVPAGTEISVRTNEYINSRVADGRIYTGTLDRDVYDRDGNVALPRGSEVELMARRVDSNEMALDLASVSAFGRRYTVEATEQGIAGNGNERAGIGENRRTAKYVGGGAVIGSIIGAIAGGGKGAAIGAAAGAASGAGAQIATRGRAIVVPSESVVTFRLERPIYVVQGGDPGYMRDGHHYHPYRDYYNEGPRDRDR